MRARPLLFKTIVTLAIVIASSAAGNLSLSLGMKSPQSALSPWVFLGIALLTVWTLARMALLSWADLSYVLPVTAIGYPLSALLGKLFFAEQIAATRWAGIALIVAGTVLVGFTAPSSQKDRS